MADIYKDSLSLLTDLYQLTMAYGYWKTGLWQKEAVFHLFFRKRPFGGNFAICAGLEQAVGFIQNFRFDESDLAYIGSLKGSNEAPLFEQRFLDYLRSFKLTCNLDAMPEGTAALAYEPLLRVQAPLIHAQLLESPLLNLINFQTLIATKAARVCYAAAPDHVVEFGMRRAQGVDGAISATRAAFIGGCLSTSHMLGGKLFGIPVKGTQAHSWVMVFDEEEEAFRVFAEAMPGNALFLVDTYDSIEGTKKAIRVALRLKKQGIHVLGLRLDSGDLTTLSIEIRRLLDEAGLSEIKIMARNELDEYLISDLKHQGSLVTVWGVGTHLVTGKEQPALSVILDIFAVRDPGGKWQYKLKISEMMSKMTDPGILQVRRYETKSENLADMIYDVDAHLGKAIEIHPIDDPMQKLSVDPQWNSRDLLIPIFRDGKLISTLPSLQEIQTKSLQEQAHFPPSMRRFLHPERYLVGYEKSLYERKCRMVKSLITKREKS